MERRVAASQAGSGPRVGKAVSLSTFQRKTGWSQAGVAVAGMSQSCADSPGEAAQPRGHAQPQLCQERTDEGRGDGEGVRGVFMAGF